MSDYKHGEMDITEHTSTFAGFIKGTVILCVVCTVVLVGMAIFLT